MALVRGASVVMPGLEPGIQALSLDGPVEPGHDAQNSAEPRSFASSHPVPGLDPGFERLSRGAGGQRRQIGKLRLGEDMAAR